MSANCKYDRQPTIEVRYAGEDECLEGWAEIGRHLRAMLTGRERSRVALECYPGVLLGSLESHLREQIPGVEVIRAEQAYKDAALLRDQFAATFTADPVFGRMQSWTIASYIDEARREALEARIASAAGPVFVIGAGAHLLQPEADHLLHAGVTRWELQRRQRRGDICNLGLENVEDAPQALYKKAYFLEWRVADQVRHELFAAVDAFLDLDDPEAPRLVGGDLLRRAVAETVHRPFRVVPFFDPGPWGGDWMMRTFDLPRDVPNYAWCFDCVPEENSIALAFGSRRFQLPAIVLVHQQPQALLGSAIYTRFGAEFPIRFDLLDTFGGSNLSLQVHPLDAYIREHFGLAYTQDESYYILDQSGASQVYLGVRGGVDPSAMRAALEAAQAGDAGFEAETFINVWPTHKHDHFSIPAGTVHCSGRDNLVLEISATPYIFTFKLWDWGRLGLDGKPRPIHLDHGFNNIQWSRDTGWVRIELLGQTTPVASGEGWREERTGLHRSQFLETRRTWFTAPVPFDTEGNLHVLNLVEGEAVLVESPGGAFAPLEIHYAETFIVPASVGPYTIRPIGDLGRAYGVIRAFLRDEPFTQPVPAPEPPRRT